MGLRVLPFLALAILLIGEMSLSGCTSGSSSGAVRVVTLGDSVAYDADPGIAAALVAIHGAEVHNRSFGGIGLSRPMFEEYLQEAIDIDPDVVTLMLGGWDLSEAVADPGLYRLQVIGVIDRISASGARVFWLGMPVTPPNEKIEESRRLLNRIIREAVEDREFAYWVDTDLSLADPLGKFTRFQVGLDGAIDPIRKVRNGRDDGHLCPVGAALLGEAVVVALESQGILDPENRNPISSWWTAQWTSDQRYDDPAGACLG